MATFLLTVATPGGMVFDGEVERVVVRTISGDVGILAGHSNYVAPLAIGGIAVVTADSTRKTGAIAGGLIKVDREKTTILTNACEWAEEIDVERAKRAAERAKQYLEAPTELHTEEVARIKLQRAINRINIAGRK